MAGIKIVTDSASDLAPDLAERHDITVVPLTIRFGDTEFLDRRDLTPEQFWSRCETSPVLPETAAPSPGAFRQVFEEAADSGYDGAVCISLSSALSATFQSASAGAESLGSRFPVRVIDSCSITMGEGLIALSAARMSADGKGLEDVTLLTQELVTRTRLYGAIDTLDYLKKGGRISGGRALLGSLLSFKPIIEVRNGLVEAESRQRTRSRSLRYVVDKVRQHDHIEQLAIMDAAAPDIGTFRDMMAEVFPREDTILGDVGPVIGAHSGPGTLGVTFLVP
ncbi:MAG TPA: DegV family protein [Acidimicrobiales bacterium]|jgi:DegV family protein with EDD domain|nr:DegV family protein [Acidimicrobiales bacterium]